VIRLSRKQILGLLILCGAVILHATMWPYNFRFDWGSVPARLLSATDLPFADGRLAEKKDIVLNVILFLPFGVLLFLQRAKAIASNRSVLVPALLGMLFSVSIETTQCFLPTRTPSLVDVCSNTLGALFGAIAAWTSLRMVEQTTEEEARRAFRRNVLFLSLAAYSLVLVASNVYTLDPVRSLPELANRGKAFHRSSWIEDATLAKAAGPILYLGVLTYLAAEWAMLSFPGFRFASTYFIVFLAGSAFALCLETLQVFFRSRVPLRSDILFGAVGCWYGILLHRLTGFPVFRALGDRFTDSASVLKYRLPALKPVFLLHYPLLILYAFLYPFDFSVFHFHFDVRALIPFYYHVTHADYASLYVILRPAVAWLPAGIVIAYARSNAKRPFSYRSATLLAAASQSFIETGRAFTEYRHPDVTNVLLAAVGAAAGMYLYHRVLSSPLVAASESATRR
jgi:VanZ family protein